MILQKLNDVDVSNLNHLTTSSLQENQRNQIVQQLMKNGLSNVRNMMIAWPLRALYDKSKGIYLVASRDIEEGEIILSEIAPVSALRDEFIGTHCGSCFRRFNQDRIVKVQAWLKQDEEKGIPKSYLCRDCEVEENLISLCDKATCYSKVDQDKKIDGLWFRFFQRALLLGDKSPFISNSGDVTLPSVCASWLLPGKVDSDLDDLGDVEIQQTTKFLLKTFSTSIQSPDESLTALLFQNIAYNCHAIAEMSMILGIANFPLASWFNHSCDPNVFWIASCPNILSSDKAPRWQGRSCKKIKVGEEITISYGPRTSQHNFLKRQGRLLEGFYFRCFCTACTGVCWSCQKKSGNLTRCPECNVWDWCTRCKNSDHDCEKWKTLEKSCHSHA